MTPAELDMVLQWSREKSPLEIHELLKEERIGNGIAPICLTSVRKAMRGATHLRGRNETRGRKRSVTARGIQALDKARIRLQENVGGLEEITWGNVIKSARINPVHPTTAARRMAAAGKDIKWRRPREKPQRTREQMEARVEVCKKLLKLPKNYFSERVDLIIDNKLWPVPTTEQAK